MEYIKEYWGITEYYKNGVLHRDGDLPAVITVRGHKEYWKNGKRHRDHTNERWSCDYTNERCLLMV